MQANSAMMADGDDGEYYLYDSDDGALLRQCFFVQSSDVMAILHDRV